MAKKADRKRPRKSGPAPLSDAELWRHVVRDVTPLPSGSLAGPQFDAPAALPSAGKADSAAAPPPARRRVQPGPPPKAPPPKIKPELLHGEMRDLDRRSAERLKRGQLPIEAQLDLHGLNQLDAQRALEAFLAAAQEAGRRCVLVITGKGGVGRAPAGGEAGVLRRAVPLWLNQAGLREKVLAYAYAQPKHGGQGALYVLVKRQRSGC
ncbi:MAG: Smr/MutS family protein [Rhodovibrionaceae bacterium]